MHSLKGKKVLVVEDEVSLAENLQFMLEDLGCAVVAVVGTIEAALAIAISSQVDVAVLDVNVQGEQSSAIAKALQMRGIPFLLATGNAPARSSEFGDAPVLPKPYLQEDLRMTLSELLKGRAADVVTTG